MIYGIGTDIVAIARLQKLLARHGRLALTRILAPTECADFQQIAERQRPAFLAKHWAAKEAFAKALGSGLRPPATLTHIAVTHDTAGKPGFILAPELSAQLTAHGIIAHHLSLSDEAEYAIAHVILESA
jgi:holo-[acyl-carrier protein] synthase